MIWWMVKAKDWHCLGKGLLSLHERWPSVCPRARLEERSDLQSGKSRRRGKKSCRAQTWSVATFWGCPKSSIFPHLIPIIPTYFPMFPLRLPRVNVIQMPEYFPGASLRLLHRCLHSLRAGRPRGENSSSRSRDGSRLQGIRAQPCEVGTFFTKDLQYCQHFKVCLPPGISTWTWWCASTASSVALSHFGSGGSI